MTLFEKFEDAYSRLSVYKNPDIGDFQEELDEVLEAAGLETTFGDKIEYIDCDDETVYIGTSYSVRCCEQTNTIHFPLFLIKAPDPLKAAENYKKENLISSLKQTIKKCEQDILKAQQSIDQCHQQLASLTSSN